jgi:hypothetical protein
MGLPKLVMWIGFLALRSSKSMASQWVLNSENATCFLFATPYHGKRNALLRQTLEWACEMLSG